MPLRSNAKTVRSWVRGTHGCMSRALGAIWDLTLAMTANASLPDNVRQIAILVVGARFDAAYEIYAHIAWPRTRP
jgi:aromatic ring hydroxylase